MEAAKNRGAVIESELELRNREDLSARQKPQPSTEFKWYNGVRYERKTSGPLAGKLVAADDTLITIDGAQYAKYTILMRIEFG